MPTIPSVTALIEFRAAADFQYAAVNAAPERPQKGRGGEKFLTSARQFATRVLTRNPEQFAIADGQRRIDCLDPAVWGTIDFSRHRVLFLLPSQALGNNVCTLLFLHAFLEQRRPRQIGVFCAQSTADIYASMQACRVHPLWISLKQLKTWDMVIDLGHLESRRDIDIWPVDQEAELLDVFALEPTKQFPVHARAIASGRPLQIGLLPLASSPLRTLPVSTTLALIEALEGEGEISLCLNRYQHQGVMYAKALEGKLPASVRVIDLFDSIAALIAAVAGFDYAVMADSGPAHMSKLAATPGVAVYTSAPAEPLLGRFKNLAAWTVPFQGPHCSAPCGLAKLRQSADGRVGCMGSLGLTLAELPSTPSGGQNPALVEKLMAAPVPCVRQLADDPAPLTRFVRDDLAARRAYT